MRKKFFLRVLLKQVVYMKIQAVSNLNYNSKGQAFKSVYPIYHWQCNGDKLEPILDVPAAKKCQKRILGILNSTEQYCKGLSLEFIKKIHNLILKDDKDFEKEHCAISFYDNKAGIKRDLNGNLYKIEPCTYLITGSDAIFFDLMFRRPIGHTKSDAKLYNLQDDPKIREDLLSYYLNGKDFVNAKSKEFEQEKNLELHAYFNGSKLEEIKFYPCLGAENPFVKMGYYS